MTWSFEVAARTLCQEARGEPLDGQQAVAHVIKNRVALGKWGTSLAEVCLYHAQFSGWWCPRGTPAYHDPNFAYACRLSDTDAMLVHMRGVLQSVLDSATDPTDSATHYCNLALAQPTWIAGAIHCGKFGHQDFYKGVK